MYPLCLQLSMNARAAVALATFCMHALNHLAQPFVILLAMAGLAFSPGVMPIDRHLQDSTEQGHNISFLLRSYEGVLHFCSCVKTKAIRQVAFYCPSLSLF